MTTKEELQQVVSKAWTYLVGKVSSDDEFQPQMNIILKYELTNRYADSQHTTEVTSTEGSFDSLIVNIQYENNNYSFSCTKTSGVVGIE